MSHYLNPKVSETVNACVRAVAKHTDKSISSVVDQMLEDALRLPKYQHLLDDMIDEYQAKLKKQKQEQVLLKMSLLMDEYLAL